MYVDIKVFITLIPLLILASYVLWLCKAYFQQSWALFALDKLFALFVIYALVELAWIIFRGVWL